MQLGDSSRDIPRVNPDTELSHLFLDWDTATPDEKARAMELIYPELHRIATTRMRRERSDHTLQATALVNEFFLHLAKSRKLQWRDRAHFLAMASHAMRRLLVDYCRAHNAEKRGGGALRVSFTMDETHHESEFDLIEINEIMNKLAAEEPRMARVVELRCFGGLTHAEIAEVLGIDERTVKRDWQVARAWLFSQLKKGNDDVGGGMGEN